MQSSLLNFLILALLVALFGSIYRKRASGRLRFWVGGWVLVLLHFAAGLAHPASDLMQNVDESLSLSALILAGICFLLSSTPVSEDPWGCTLVASFIGIPALFYTNYLVFGGGYAFALYTAAAIGAAGGTMLAWSFYRQRVTVLITLTMTFIAGEFWTFYAIAHHKPAQGISAILSEIFLAFAALYWFDCQRISAGVVTTVLGLVAWAAVFPVSILCNFLIPAVQIPPGFWNVPKYFVAFGMILTLLENEIFAVGKASEHYRLLFAANPHPMWVYDPATLRFLKVNDAAIDHYGYSRTEFLSMTLRELRPTEDIEAILQETAASNSTTLSGPWLHRKKDGSCIQVDMAAHAIDFEGRSCRFVLVQDVTERQRLHEQLVHQAHHDTLTGLPNRLLLKDRMQQTLARASRHAERAAVICIDLDRFKHINDTFGHAVGDLCLQQVASRLANRLRAVDTVARTGGEEFLILLGEVNSPADAETVARDVLECLRHPIEADGYVLQVSASLGVAIYPDDGADSSELWRNADRAMYRAKNSGGGQYLLVSHEISTLASEANELERYMRRMLKEDGFELHYQPQYSISGQLCGLEALLRLNHPVMGAIPPDRFVPIAEECNLIVPLGNWVLEEVCRQSMQWQRQGLQPMRIAFNVSPLQFVRADFSAHVIRTLAESGLDPRLLELEVTETTVMRNIPEVARQMQNLASLGIHFSVDDFGTGYSSLSHLHQLPVSTLKIDCSFIERISDANGTYSIVQAIIALGHSLGLQVVAEGVERSDQMECLRILDCDSLQGYLLAAPMPASRIPKYLVPAYTFVRNRIRQEKNSA